jgi:hypothetical protein
MEGKKNIMVGQTKAKAQALKDITTCCKECESSYNQNYASKQHIVIDMLENFNPIVYFINTVKL